MPKVILNPPSIVRSAEEDLFALAKRIKDREQHTADNILQHAKEQGEDLMKVRRQVGSRKFAPWWKEHTDLGKTTVYAYIKIAENWERIRSATELITVADALRVLKEAEQDAPRDRQPPQSPSKATRLLQRWQAMDKALTETVEPASFARQYHTNRKAFLRDLKAFEEMGQQTKKFPVDVDGLEETCWRYEPGILPVFVANLPAKVREMVEAAMRGDE